MPRISVIMPVWNVEPYLRECMDSILNQTMGDFEFICIDDASDDGSPAILAEYAARDPRVKLLRTEHVGAYLARKAGVDIACGEFAYFMDSDDILDVRAFEELLAFADGENLDQVIFSAEVFSSDEDAASFEERRRRFEAYYAIPDALCNQVMSGADLMFALERVGHFFVSPPFRLLRLAPFKECEYPFPHGAPFHADEYFTPVSLYFARRAMIVNRRYYKRRVRPGSISTVANKEKIHYASLLNVLFWLCSFKPLQEDMLLHRTQIAAHMLTLVHAIQRRGECLDVETKTQLLSEIRLPLAPEMQMFLSACFIPLLEEMQETKREMERRRVERKIAQAKRNHDFSDVLRCNLDSLGEANSDIQGELASIDRETSQMAKKAAGLKREIGALSETASYKTGLALTWPLRKVYRLVCQKGNG